MHLFILKAREGRSKSQTFIELHYKTELRFLSTCLALTNAESCFHSPSPPVSRTNHVSVKHIFSDFTRPCNKDFIEYTGLSSSMRYMQVIVIV